MMKTTYSTRKRGFSNLRLIPLILLVGCTTTHTDYTAEFASGSIRTVQLRPVAVDGQNVFHTSIFNDRMTAAVRATLTQAGLVEGTPHDAVLTWQVTTEAGKDKRAPYPYDHPLRRYGPHPALDHHNREPRTGMLIIDLVDPVQSNKLLWRGWQEIDLGRPSLSANQLHRATAYVLRSLPKSKLEAQKTQQ